MTIVTATLLTVLAAAILGGSLALCLCKAAAKPTPPMPRYVKLRYIGVQHGPAHYKPVPLFNVVDGDYTVGSTITLNTAFRQGLRVELVDENYHA